MSKETDHNIPFSEGLRSAMESLAAGYGESRMQYESYLAEEYQNRSDPSHQTGGMNVNYYTDFIHTLRRNQDTLTGFIQALDSHNRGDYCNADQMNKNLAYLFYPKEFSQHTLDELSGPIGRLKESLAKADSSATPQVGVLETIDYALDRVNQPLKTYSNRSKFEGGLDAFYEEHKGEIDQLKADIEEKIERRKKANEVPEESDTPDTDSSNTEISPNNPKKRKWWGFGQQ